MISSGNNSTQSLTITQTQQALKLKFRTHCSHLFGLCPVLNLVVFFAENYVTWFTPLC